MVFIESLIAFQHARVSPQSSSLLSFTFQYALGITSIVSRRQPFCPFFHTHSPSYQCPLRFFDPHCFPDLKIIEGAPMHPKSSTQFKITSKRCVARRVHYPCQVLRNTQVENRRARPPSPCLSGTRVDKEPTPMRQGSDNV